MIDALDHPRDFVMEVYLHPRPENAGANSSNLNWNGVSSGTQAKIGEKLVQTGLVVRAPDLFALEDESVSEYKRLAFREGKKGTSPQKINELLTAQIPVAVEKHERLVAEYVRAHKPVFYYNPDFDLASIPRLFIESVEAEGPIFEWPPRGRTELFFAGEATSMRLYPRDLARFCREAYRRAVEPEEVDDWVDWCFRPKRGIQAVRLRRAVKEGVKALLARLSLHSGAHRRSEQTTTAHRL